MKSIYIILFVYSCSGLLHAFEESSFSHYKEVKVALAEEGIASVLLDSEIFDRSNDDFADVRVVNVEGVAPVETPWDLERVEIRKRPGRREISTEKVSFSEGNGNRLEITVKLTDKKLIPNRLTIATPLSNFERRVQVFGSDDGSNWIELVESALIFDYSRFLDFRRTSVEIPPNSHEFLRVVIDGAVENLVSPYREISKSIEGGEVTEKEIASHLSTRPFRIDRLNFHFSPDRIVEVETGRENYRVSGIEVSEDEENQQTVVTILSLRQPLTHFTLHTESKNFRRAVHLQIPEYSENLAETKWRTLSGGSLLRYDIGKVNEERLTLKTGEQRQSAYRLIIENRDNAPLKVTGVSTSGPGYELRFLSEANQKYRIYYGGMGSEAKRPSYDVSALKVAKEKGVKAETFAAGPEKSNSVFDASLPKSDQSILDNKWFLWGAIALVVLILIIVLFRAAKRIEELPSE